MTSMILTTKLQVPRLRPSIVRRARLLEQLNEGLGSNTAVTRALTLVCAPAGFGKTTLVSNWIEGRDRHVARLSLDERDSDPRGFLKYLAAALEIVHSELGASLHEAQQPLVADFSGAGRYDVVLQGVEDDGAGLDDREHEGGQDGQAALVKKKG